MAEAHGKFVWHELMNTDPQAVASFYNKLFGWKPQAWDKDPSYTVWLGSKGPAAGAMRGQDGSRQPEWLSYTAVSDITGAVSTAQRLGGRVVKDVTDLPDGGKFAVLADPQGAHFGVFTAPGNASAGGNMAVEFSWHELATTDHAAALRFYRELFGWEELATHDMGATMGVYVLFGRDGQQLGGMFNRSASMPGEPGWLAYATVRDASKAADAAKASGGRVINGPHEVPGGSWIVQLLDPLGAMIAVVEPPRPAAATASEKPNAAKAPGTASREKPVAAKPATKPAPAAATKAAPPTQKPAGGSRGATKKAAGKGAKKASTRRVTRTAKAAKKPKRVAKKARRSKAPAKARSAISRARAVVKRVVSRVMRKKSPKGRRRR